MEKLIELLNEFRPAVSCANFKEHYEFIDDDICLIREWMDGEEEQFPMYVCYKKGEFIKWLVENDKIDSWTRNPLFITELVGEQEKQMPYSFYEEMLIRLALSDTPIEDLISYLK